MAGLRGEQSTVEDPPAGSRSLRVNSLNAGRSPKQEPFAHGVSEARFGGDVKREADAESTGTTSAAQPHGAGLSSRGSYKRVDAESDGGSTTRRQWCGDSAGRLRDAAGDDHCVRVRIYGM